MTNRPIVVMKFGGTSVADASGRQALARRVLATLETGAAPVVVVSAMGRAGAPYATDTLLGLTAGLPSSDRERDLLASVGECISAVVVAHELRGAGVDAIAFSGADAGILTDDHHTAATITEIHTGALVAALDSLQVPVVAGFQGVAPDGSITTLGRGGSDTTACALGVALSARSVEIYTDVDGVMSADPRAIDDAGVLTCIGAEELFQMARHGSRVVHTPAAELALGSGIGLRVRNTFSDHEGTHVADVRSYAPSGVATAVSHTSGIVRFTVRLADVEGSDDHMSAQTRIYEAMAASGVSLDMFTPAAGTLVFTTSDQMAIRAREVLDALGAAFDVLDRLTKVTLIGAGMHGVPGVMARMARCLCDAGVHVLQTADSHTTISALVPEPEAQAALEALHRGFDLGR